ncbi:MAG: hypothetical protein HY655_03115, partial [Acidobacteria bacterium]|nr:hypothetical protein [Acidobacteriota bacterium]
GAPRPGEAEAAAHAARRGDLPAGAGAREESGAGVNGIHAREDSQATIGRTCEEGGGGSRR